MNVCYYRFLSCYWLLSSKSSHARSVGFEARLISDAPTGARRWRSEARAKEHKNFNVTVCMWLGKAK